MNRTWLGILFSMTLLPLPAAADGGALGASLVVSRQSQSASGIQVEALTATSQQPTIRVYGFVESLAPLVSLAQQASTWRARLAADRARAVSADAEYRRLALLFRDQQNVARKRVQAAFADRAAAQADVQRDSQGLTSVSVLARLRWGAALQRGVITGRGPLRPLLSGTAVLTEINVPLSAGLHSPPESLPILPPDGGPAVTAHLISMAPSVNPGVQGMTYFYGVSAPWARTGLGVTALMPVSEASQAGVVVPERAVVWYGNRSWVYVRTDATRFARIAVHLGARTQGGWFVESGLSPHDQLVVTGAELLLSQELLSQSSGAGGDD